MRPSQRNINKVSLAFSLLLLIVVVVWVVESFSYPFSARLFPLMIGIPTVVFFILVVLSAWFPKLTAESSLFEGMKGGPAAVTRVDVAVLKARRGLIAVTALTVVLTSLIFFVGFIIATPVSLFFFLRFQGHQSWLKSGIFAIAVTMFLWAGFEVGMGLRLFQGVLFGGYL